MKKKNNNIFLMGERIYLRILRLKDVNTRYLSWMNDEGNSYIPATSYTNTMASLKKYVTRKLKNPNALFFAIIDIQVLLIFEK